MSAQLTTQERIEQKYINQYRQFPSCPDAFTYDDTCQRLLQDSLRANSSNDIDDYGLQAFVWSVFATDRNSYYQISERWDCTRTNGKPSWTETDGYLKNEMLGKMKQLADETTLRLDRNWHIVEYFVSHNGSKIAGSRAVTNIRHVNCMTFDIDFHECDIDDLATAKECAIRIIDCSIAEKKLPEYTMIVDSGRGLHLYYALETSTPTRTTKGKRNTRGLKWISDQEKKIDTLLRYVLRGAYGAQVDTSVHDLSRVLRIPGTYNPHSKTRCRVVAFTGKRASLVELTRIVRKSLADAFFGDTQTTQEDTVNHITSTKKRKKNKPKHLLQRDNELAQEIARRRNNCNGVTDESYMSSNEITAMLRMDNMKDLVTCRNYNCTGYREKMCFVFAQAAYAFYNDREKVFHELEDFNSAFTAPLPSSEIRHIFGQIDKNKTYKFTRKTLEEWFDLQPHELEIFGGLAARRRAIEMKQATQERKAERDATIIKLLKAGKKKAEIARIVGVARKTIYNRIEKMFSEGIMLAESDECDDAEARAINEQLGISSLKKVYKKPYNVSVVSGSMMRAEGGNVPLHQYRQHQQSRAALTIGDLRLLRIDSHASLPHATELVGVLPCGKRFPVPSLDPVCRSLPVRPDDPLDFSCYRYKSIAPPFAYERPNRFKLTPDVSHKTFRTRPSDFLTIDGESVSSAKRKLLALKLASDSDVHGLYANLGRWAHYYNVPYANPDGAPVIPLGYHYSEPDNRELSFFPLLQYLTTLGLDYENPVLWLVGLVADFRIRMMALDALAHNNDSAFLAGLVDFGEKLVNGDLNIASDKAIYNSLYEALIANGIADRVDSVLSSID